MNNRVWKKSVSVLLVTALGFTLAACGGKNEEKGSASAGQAGENKPVKLRILWWGSQARHDATLKVLDMYTKKHPNVTFEPEFTGWDGYWDKLSTQAAAKNAPDIIQMDAAYLAEYASRKQLADLSAGIDTKDMDPPLLNTGKYKDKLYAIPLGNNAFGMTYNKAALEKLGVTLPKYGWTWDDFFKMGEEAKAKLGKDKYVLLDLTTDFGDYTTYQLSKGKGAPLTEDGKFNLDKDTWIEWQKKFVEMRSKGIVPPADVTVTDKELDPKLDLMANETVLLRHMHAAQATAVDSLKPGAMAMVTTPRGKEAGGWLKPAMFWSVSADSKYVEESKKFIDWFINDQEANEVLGTSRGVPVSKKVLDTLLPKFSPADKMGVELINKTAADAQKFVAEPSGWSNFTKKDYKTVVEKIMFGKATPEQAYDELIKMAKEYQN